MPRKNSPTRLEDRRLQLWLHGCALIGAVGLSAVLMMSVKLYRAQQRSPLAAPPERINPNTASVASLVRLPGVGRTRALDIVHYRDRYQQDGSVFQSPQDLERIRGIGPKTAGNISPWLVFEGSEPQINTNEHENVTSRNSKDGLKGRYNLARGNALGCGIPQ